MLCEHTFNDETRGFLFVNGFKWIILYNNVPIKTRNCAEALAFTILLAIFELRP
jgi:hypothetical protein